MKDSSLNSPPTDVDNTKVVETSEVGVWTGDDEEYFQINRKKEEEVKVDEVNQQAVENEGFEDDENENTSL